MKKIICILLAILFAASAYLNLNDPDPGTWVSAYGLVAAAFAAAAFGRGDHRLTLALGLALLIWAVTMLPGLIDWIGLGMPSITGSMKADSPHVEVVRECLGLLIAVASLGWLWSTQRPGRGTARG